MDRTTNSTRVEAPDITVQVERNRQASSMTCITQTCRDDTLIGGSRTDNNANTSANRRNHKINLRKTLRIGTWNVKSMYRKGALSEFTKEMEESKSDIMDVCETR